MNPEDSALGPDGGGTRIGPAPGPHTAGHPTTGQDATGAQLATEWELTQASDEFQALRHALRRFAFPATAAFLAWYLLYVLMSGYARGFMSIKLLGNINVAYVFGLLQFLSTFALAYVYSRYAERRLDPTADAIRHRLEGTGR